jgi:hypothetical protein
MRNARRMTLFAAAAIAIGALAASCGGASARMYTGPARPAGEVATLVTDQASTRVTSVDGMDATDYFYRRFEVLPGAHELHVGYETRTAVSGRRLVLQATVEAGKAYTVRMTQQGQELRFEIVDDASGAVVSKIVGDEENK